jgi:hypothetical protein
VYDVLLRFSRNILLAALADSCLLLISLFPVLSASFADVGHIDTPLKLSPSNLLVSSCRD